MTLILSTSDANHIYYQYTDILAYTENIQSIQMLNNGSTILNYEKVSKYILSSNFHK